MNENKISGNIIGIENELIKQIAAKLYESYAVDLVGETEELETEILRWQQKVDGQTKRKQAEDYFKFIKRV